MFRSVPEERFITDVHKTLLSYFAKDPELLGVKVMPKYADESVLFTEPTLLIFRTDLESWDLDRTSGFYGYNDKEGDTTKKYLYGYTYKTTFQFDIYGNTRVRVNDLTSLVYKKLRSFGGADVFANGGPTTTQIPLRDFVSPADEFGELTDLSIKFRFWEDLNSHDVETFDRNLYQHSMMLKIWVPYLKEYEYPKIQKITQSVDIIT